MGTVTAVVGTISPVKAGKKYATVKATDGTFLQVKQPELGTLQPGGKYTFNYKENNFNGVTYRMVESVTPVGGSNGSAVVAGDADNKKRNEHIFVCGALNAALSNPNITPTALDVGVMIALINNFRAVYANTLGKAQRDNEMNDEIPFA